MVKITESKYKYTVPGLFEVPFVQVNIVGDPADMRLVDVHHHTDAHLVLSLKQSYGRGRRLSRKNPDGLW
jgi:hypothetical protein